MCCQSTIPRSAIPEASIGIPISPGYSHSTRWASTHPVGTGADDGANQRGGEEYPNCCRRPSCAVSPAYEARMGEILPGAKIVRRGSGLRNRVGDAGVGVAQLGTKRGDSNYGDQSNKSDQECIFDKTGAMLLLSRSLDQVLEMVIYDHDVAPPLVAVSCQLTTVSSSSQLNNETAEASRGRATYSNR